MIALKKRVLVVLGGGGHTAQMRRLVSLLGRRYAYAYIAAHSDGLAPRNACRILSPREKDDRGWLMIALKTFVACCQSLFVLLKTRPAAILACGPALAVPVCIMGKLLGAKVVYLESWARVRSQSLSAQLTRPFADLFLVQWPSSNGRFAGRLA